jgi:D-3-phosphoglycerate dehydrogenase
MIRILNIEPDAYSAEARSILQQIGTVDEAIIGREELLRVLPAYDVLILRLKHQVDREVLDAGTRLKAVVSATTGLDHIDEEYAAQKGVAVLSLRGETEFLRQVSATAELTWALLLSLFRRLPQAIHSVRRGLWERDCYRGTELYGKRLGILGLGRVGRKVANYGLAFGMSVLAYDPYAAEWPGDVRYVAALPDLLRRSDILSIHVPLNEQTQGMLGLKELAELPLGAVVVNTSRGEILDENALVLGLESGRIGGGALDVMCHEREPELRERSPLLAYARWHDNLILTPHIGGATRESMKRTEIFMAYKLAGFLKNEESRAQTV